MSELNQECRELLNEIRDERLWETYNDPNAIVKMEKPADDDYLGKLVWTSLTGNNDAAFAVVKAFETKKARDAYEEKVEELRGRIEINVSYPWDAEKVHGSFLGEQLGLESNGQFYSVIFVYRDTAQFYFDCWRPWINSQHERVLEGLKAQGEDVEYNA